MEEKKYLIINTKLYNEAFNEHLKELISACQNLEDKASKKTVELILVPEIVDLTLSTQKVKTFAQHVDPVYPGSHTGFISPQHVSEKGAIGTLLNHSEHKIPLEDIERTTKIAKEVGLKVCVCIKTPEEITQIKEKIIPDMFAYEPEELIGGDVSVSSKEPESIAKAKNLAGETPLLVGAGIKNSKDIEIAIKLGSKGVLVASGIDKADNKQEAIEELLKGY